MMLINDYKIEDFIGVFDIDIHQIEIDKYIDYFNRCESMKVSVKRNVWNTHDKTIDGKYIGHIQDRVNSIGPDLVSLPEKSVVGSASYRLIMEKSGELSGIFNNISHARYEKYCDKFFTLRTIQSQIYNVNIQRTLPGEGYHVWHCENEHTYRSSNTRVLAVMMYLNDIDDDAGGETEFIYLHKRFKPKRARVLMWPSGFTHTHRGNAPLKGEKYIITGWIERNLQDNSILG